MFKVKIMKRSVLAIIVIFLASILLSVEALAAPTGREIMELVDQRDDGDNQTADIQMILKDKNNKVRKRTISLFAKDKGRDTLRLQFFLTPADVKDTGFLTYDYYLGEKDDDQWLYLPDLHKTKRIASSDKSSSFMGSDFSYADMTRRVLDEWKYRFLKEDKVGEHKVWLVEALPASKLVEDRYGYTKSIVFVRQDNAVVIRAIHVLKEGGKVKYMEVKKLDKVDNIWVATETHMKTTKKRRTLHQTVLKFNNVRYNQDLNEDLFSVRRLEKGL
jgi:hypothetical protein